MNKQRLSKLQKWVLQTTYEKSSFSEKTFKHYFKGDVLTPAERVTKSRSLKNMIAKGLIEKFEGKNNLGRYHTFKLTQKGFEVLNVNEMVAATGNVNFNDYLKRFEKGQEEYVGWANTLAGMIRATR